jgi:hypothetical protein
VKYSGDEFIWVKPVCDFFNLSVQSEYRKIKKDPILGKLWTESSTELSKKSDQYRFLSRESFTSISKINYENQTIKIKSDKILANHSIKKSSSLMFGDNYPRILVMMYG